MKGKFGKTTGRARADGRTRTGGARMKVVSFEIVTHANVANWSGLIYAQP